MTAFATAADFADLTGLTLTSDQETRADNLLGRASDRIRETVKQEISLVPNDVYSRPGTTDKRILLPQRPVVSVASVTLDGTAISDWYLAGDELVRRGIAYVDRILDDQIFAGRYGAGGFGWEQQTLTIVYTHGYDTDSIPEICRSIALEMVKRVWVNPGGVIQEIVADSQVTYAPYAEPPRGLALTNSERGELRRFFGSQVGSVWTGSAP